MGLGPGAKRDLLPIAFDMRSPRLQATQFHVAESAEGRSLRNGQGRLVHDNARVRHCVRHCVRHAGCISWYGRGVVSLEACQIGYRYWRSYYVSVEAKHITGECDR